MAFSVGSENKRSAQPRLHRSEFTTVKTGGLKVAANNNLPP